MMGKDVLSEARRILAEGGVIHSKFSTLQAQKNKTPYHYNPEIADDIPLYDPKKKWHTKKAWAKGHEEQFHHFKSVPRSEKSSSIVGVAHDGTEVPFSTSTHEVANALADSYNRRGFTDKDIQKVPLVRALGGRVKTHKGPIHSNVAGRTDHLPVHLSSGSYVIPADIIGAMGEGNTMAGFKIAKRMFSSKPYFEGDKPYGVEGSPYGKSGGPYGAKLASGGEAEGEETVPAVVAGGEYVISPSEVTAIGRGNMSHGHAILDDFVKKFRHKAIKTLKSLPGPRKD